ncbi:hypothetical protein PIB30_021567 [Stylosanthes scabra]|uniref:Glucose-6-phosphate 1-epimerase n=1 Tax=Stylosanthes scabra TaxID=79078 RepID=A0ABU6TA18_9FABA|nr:hypothetical protein [Stylosanthes scabra]
MSGDKEKSTVTSAPPSPSPSSVPPSVEFTKGINGLQKFILRESRGSSAEVYLYGGHVTSWKNDHGEELLFLSSKAIFKPPKAIRGGIPICFPQFAGHGTLDQHGFARNRFWAVDEDPPPFPTNTLNKAFVDLILKPSEEDMKIWPHSFEYRLRVALGTGGDLMLTSRIRNTNSDGKPFTFTFAYHTYFSVSDIRLTKYILALLQRLQLLIMKKRGHLFCAKMVFLMLWCGILGIRKQRLWLILVMMSTSICCV